MAGHGEGEEADYWPGYVDALTAMVKVLSFVMMLMATAVFVLSQNVSKSIVQHIAEAARVDNPDDDNVSALTERVMAKLKTLAEVKPQDSRASEAKAPESKAQDVKPPSPPAASSENRIETRPLPQETKTEATKVVVAQEESKPPVALKDTAVKMDTKNLSLSFPDHQSAMDDKTKAAVSEFIGASGMKDSPAIFIEAKAFVGAGSLSEVRRIAFYRAMMVRQQLVQDGINSKVISLKVVDTTIAGEAPQVNVLVQQ